MCNEKKHSRSCPQTFLSQHTFLTRTMKSWQNAILISQGTVFFILPKYWEVSKYTVLLSTFSFPKKEINKSTLRRVNLCNGGTKDFVKLWEIIHLKIWTRFSIRQMKLFWINLRHYSQTCSNNHLCMTTTHLRQPMLSLFKQIPIHRYCIRKPPV